MTETWWNDERDAAVKIARHTNGERRGKGVLNIRSNPLLFLVVSADDVSPLLSSIFYFHRFDAAEGHHSEAADETTRREGNEQRAVSISTVRRRNKRDNPLLPVRA